MLYFDRSKFRPPGKSREQGHGNRNDNPENRQNDKSDYVTKEGTSDRMQQDWSSKGARPKSEKPHRFQAEKSANPPNRRKNNTHQRPKSAIMTSESSSYVYGSNENQYLYQRQSNIQRGPGRRPQNADTTFDIRRTGSESRLNFSYHKVTEDIETRQRGRGRNAATKLQTHAGRTNGNGDMGNKEIQIGRKFVIGFPFLKNLMGKDPGYIVLELTKNKNALNECLKRTSEDQEFLEVFLQALSEAYLSRSTPGHMIELFDTLKEANFFDSVVFLLIDVLGKGANIESRTKQMIRNIIKIINAQLIQNPSSIFVVSRASTLLCQIIDGLPKDNDADEELLAMFQDLTEQKERLEKEKRTCSEHRLSRKPPDDYRQYSVSPNISEITGTNRPFLRQNKVEGQYDDLDHYLDVQFRLLREDFVGPLREGITEYVKIKTSKQQDNQSVRKLDIKIYENVTVHTPVITEYGLCYKMQLEMTRFVRHVNWSVSKRLLYGSLVCLTDNEFNSFYLATVVGRDEEDIRNGYFIVHFEEYVNTHEILNRVFQMAESPAYFESYRHVLSSLQTLKKGDLPFEKYIVYCDRKVDPPAYLKPGKIFDLRPLVDENVTLHSETRLQNIGAQIRAGIDIQFSAKSFKAKSVDILDKNSWPSKDLLQLDESQYDAVQTALTSEFSIIQGPPGTGKTYIGLKIVKALLHNRSAWLGFRNQIRPMLVVCFTNHALDQFLEGIAKYFKGDILRVVGRSESEIIRNFNIKHYRQRHQPERSQLGKLRRSKFQARDDLKQQSEELDELAKTIEIYRSEIVGECYLREQMGIRLYNSLINNYRGEVKGKNFSYIMKWLGIKYIETTARQQVEGEARQDDFVNVEDNTKHRQRDMLMDLDGEDEEQAKKKSQERLIRMRRRAGIVFFVHVEEKKSQTPEDKKHAIYQKLLKEMIISRLASFDVMSEEEAEEINDVWRLDHNAKWRLYRSWVQKLCTEKYDEIEARRARFELAAERYREAMMQEDREIMSKASVIGMTTSCAARYQAVLRDIGPRIVIVEEAAEVLEAHIVTTLSKGCEQLILIGDHKQLRPNPTVYRLAIKYKLDVSLFERMIKNKMEFNCLKLQHRMRPTISSLVKHIYPDLLDHHSVSSYPDIKGISTNLFLIDHENEENSDDDIRSYSNIYEAQYVAQLCQYLLLQGYRRHEITILTTYTGQLLCIRKCMPKKQFEGVKVTVVDNFQGEENNIIILSLVRSNKTEKIGFLKTENRICVALSRAKHGFYILGNFAHLAAHSTLWKNITDEMKSEGCMGNGLKLYCRNHPRDDAIIAVKPDDFKKAPEGGCQKYCDIRLKCGHVCKRYCHVLDRQHEENKCEEPCTKVLCELGHICPLKCFRECRPCKVPLQKIIPKCGHQQTVPCAVKAEDFQCQASCEEILKCGHQCKNECGEEHTSYCREEIEFTFPCGHTTFIACGDKETATCQHPCGAVLKCEHICNGTCSGCFKGKVHQPCRHDCKRILVCGHACNDYCRHCPPCTAYCENRCTHSKCDKYCGEPCVPCKEKCSWKCQHFTCTKLCSEPCNRPKCNKACRKRLKKCNHRCIGLCGEPCPKLCRICDKEKVTEIIFGDEDNKNARFVLLQDCMHVIESRALDKYMHMRDEANAIQLKGCPICKTTIRKCLRYGKLINQVLDDIERVKQQMIGDTGIIDRVTNQISLHPITSAIRHCKVNVRLNVPRILKNAVKMSRYNQYQLSFEESLKRLKDGQLCTETQLLSLENQHRLVKATLDIKFRIKENMRKDANYSQVIKQNLIVLSPEFLARLSLQVGVLSEEEFDDFTREIQRGKAYLKLLKMKSAIVSVGKDKEGAEHIMKINRLITETDRFTEDKENEVSENLIQLKELLKIDGLGITNEERLQIIKAVGLSKGHWFKCPKSK